MDLLHSIMEGHPPLARWLLPGKPIAANSSSCVGGGGGGGDTSTTSSKKLNQPARAPPSRKQPSRAVKKDALDRDGQPGARSKASSTTAISSRCDAGERPVIARVSSSPEAVSRSSSLYEPMSHPSTPLASANMTGPLTRHSSSERDTADPVGQIKQKVAAAPMLPLSTKLSVQTTCVVVPPKSQWAQFVAIKKNHMKPNIKRPPYPHISLVAPFVEHKSFGEASTLLRQRLASVEPFRVGIRSFHLFKNAANTTLYLKPEELDGENRLRTLHDACSSIIPASCWQAARLKLGAYDPHIGVGFFKSHQEACQLQQHYQQQWQPISFTVKEVYFLVRFDSNAPWQFANFVSLGKSETQPDIEMGQTTRL
eukprot:NODE_1989_length_1335_cov_10.707621_g1805_i0.p1 GENE.NODE_1989_length_1335_cov_10.707621_g1805_i0~~NODE_1989_length_1335_cov_10.707621_g1805_i0.p1  ORF type:complete len:368 (+),score=44.38 NODE_1989_length_1335_cov_10.707621_g1805_i0:79-1182(+)